MKRLLSIISKKNQFHYKKLWILKSTIDWSDETSFLFKIFIDQAYVKYFKEAISG